MYNTSSVPRTTPSMLPPTPDQAQAQTTISKALQGFVIDKMNIDGRIAIIQKEKEILEEQLNTWKESKDPNKSYMTAGTLQEEIAHLEENIVTTRAQENLTYTVPNQTDIIEAGCHLIISKFPPKMNPQAQDLSFEDIHDFDSRMKAVDKNDYSYNHRYLNHKKSGSDVVSSKQGRFQDAFRTCSLMREDAFHHLQKHLQEPPPSLLLAISSHKNGSGLLSSLAYITGVLSTLTETAPTTANDRELIEFFGNIFQSSTNYLNPLHPGISMRGCATPTYLNIGKEIALGEALELMKVERAKDEKNAIVDEEELSFMREMERQKEVKMKEFASKRVKNESTFAVKVAKKKQPIKKKVPPRKPSRKGSKKSVKDSDTEEESDEDYEEESEGSQLMDLRFKLKVGADIYLNETGRYLSQDHSQENF